MERNKMKKIMTRKLWVLVLVTVFSVFSVAILITKTKPILAKSEAKEQTNNLVRDLDPVENEEGLKVTPKVLILEQYTSFPDLNTEEGLNQLFSERIIPHPEEGADYRYVDAKGSPVDVSSDNIGFQLIYVKVTEKHNKTSIQVPIPVTVTDNSIALLLGKKVALQTDEVNDTIVLYPKDTANKTEAQLQQLVKEKSNVKSWDVENGAEVSTDVIKTTISPTSVGIYKAVFEITMGDGTDEQKASVEKSVLVFGANPNTSILYEQNTIFYPEYLFSEFQTLDSTSFDDLTLEFVDENGELVDIDRETIGFQWVYVKMTDKHYKDKYDKDIVTIIKVPINITGEETTPLFNNKVLFKYNEKLIVYPSEMKDKSKEEVLELIQSKANVSAWNTNTGEEIPTTFIETTLNNAAVGMYTGTIEVKFGKETETTEIDITFFGADFAYPYYFEVNQNETLDKGSGAQYIFSNYQTSVSSNFDDAEYEWVKNASGDPTEPEPDTFDSRQTGFHWGYIKMTDRENPDISTVISIPVTVKLEGLTSIIDSKVGMSYEGGNVFTPIDFEGKNDEQISQMITERLSLDAWELTSGKEVDVKATIKNFNVGSPEVTLKMTTSGGIVTSKITIEIVPSELFEDNDAGEWNDVPLDSKEGVITNPINGSKIGFPHRGMSDPVGYGEVGFVITDKDDTGYVYSQGQGRVSDIPGVDNKVLYGSKWNVETGVGREEINGNFSRRLFLRKGNKLKQILYDPNNQIYYVYHLSLNRNQNFSVDLNMYNFSKKKKRFSVLESVDLDYYNDGVPVYALENNSGFYMEPDAGKRFSIRLKDSNGNWLSDFTKYIVGDFAEIGIPSGDNYFGDDFSGEGSEVMDYAQGEIIMENKDSAYQLGAAWKNIEPGKALTTGYEVFAGEELPYMDIKAKPEIFNVYSDYVDDFQSNYKLSKIPMTNDHGTVYITYPSGNEVTTPFTSNSKKEFDGQLTIPRTELPERLNEEPGTIKSYDTSLLAINETEGSYNGLPSQDYSVNIKVYNLGAQPIPQIIQKGDDFQKDASEVVKNAVILPGHTPSYEYNGDMPDTSVEGLTSVTVRMTDTDQPEKSTLIKVPIQVIDETSPSSGLYIVANDFSSNTEEFKDLDEDEIKKLILKKSEAIAWDVETGSTDKIKLSVESTTLPLNPGEGSYEATIKATKGTETVEKTISIELKKNQKQKVNIEFVDETGESLHEKITLEQMVGTTINLTEEKEIQNVLETIQAKNYQLVKKPDNETQIPVTSEESTVQYQFKGMLFIQSSPNFLNFGRKSLGIPFIKVEKAKYDKPLIVWDNRKNGGAWNLTATLKNPLTSQEDPSKVLPSAIRYKISDAETVILSENTTQSIAERTHESKGEYNISNEWNENKSGLLLEVPSGEVLQAGGYRAKILWQVEQTP